MATSEQCNEAWKNGYIAGYQTARRAIPPIPPRPGGVPPSQDPVDYFYRLGYEAGRTAASR
jgi:hypothetical protein